MRRLPLVLAAFLAFPGPLPPLPAAEPPPVTTGAAAETGALRSFASPERLWGDGVEAFIERAFRQCFKTRLVGGAIMNLRIPFTENHEREALSGKTWNVPGLGKADPAALWPLIDEALSSAGFQAYAAALSDGREKVVIFDIPGQTWRTSRDVFDIARMKAGAYHGLLHEPYILVDGRGVTEADVYNYLYCVSWAGFDCSAFVWHVLSGIAREGGVNLGERLRRALGAPRGAEPSIYAGTAFYGTPGREVSAVRDRIKNLRPADLLLFRSRTGEFAHSAVVQSVDFERGVVRYLQNTDEAPLRERGPHESFIYFDPDRPDVSLADESLRWSQQRFSPFEGEQLSAFVDDGQRYRAYGGGRVVRLNVITDVIKRRWKTPK